MLGTHMHVNVRLHQQTNGDRSLQIFMRHASLISDMEGRWVVLYMGLEHAPIVGFVLLASPWSFHTFNYQVYTF